MEALRIGNRLELFTDEFLTGACAGLTKRLGTPVSRGPAFFYDAPWEGGTCCYASVVQVGTKGYFYYRGSGLGLSGDADSRQVTCVAVTEDGARFERVALDLFLPEQPGNNVILTGNDSHNFSPFYDLNPAALPEERWKALAGECGENGKHGLRAYFSPDGLHWRKKNDEPVLTEGQFDSQNVPFYDTVAGVYRCYSRYWDENGRPTGDYVGVRAIQSSVSTDFARWSHPVPNLYDTPAEEHFYTNATVPCPGAEHVLLSFPKRFAPDRKRSPDWPYPGISECVFLSSRDGVHWDRACKEAFLRPGHDELNWGDRSQMMTRGLYVHPDGSLSMYLGRHYRTDSNHVERLTLRPQGFVSLHGGWEEGELITKPLVFGRGTLRVNASTGAYGWVRIGVQNPDGTPIPGFEGDEVWYGDSYLETFPFQGDFSALAGKPVQLRIRLRDADLYALGVKE